MGLNSFDSADHMISLRPGLALEFLGDGVAVLGHDGDASEVLDIDLSAAVRALLARRRGRADELGLTDATVRALEGKGLIVPTRVTSRRSAIAAGAAGVTALALPSRSAAESASGSGNGLLIPGPRPTWRW
jgi:hypothetical protein